MRYFWGLQIVRIQMWVNETLINWSTHGNNQSSKEHKIQKIKSEDFNVKEQLVKQYKHRVRGTRQQKNSTNTELEEKDSR